jgi:hypothetical protein
VERWARVRTLAVEKRRSVTPQQGILEVADRGKKAWFKVV